jgi:hypothetical protein
MVFGLLKKAVNSIGSGIKSAYNNVTSTIKSVYTSVKNECKKITTKVKKKWNDTPLWGKVVIGAVVGAAVGIGAVVAGPAVLGATALAATATVGTAAAGGGLIGYFLHSENAKPINDQPAPQQRQNRRTNQDKNENRERRYHAVARRTERAANQIASTRDQSRSYYSLTNNNREV